MVRMSMNELSTLSWTFEDDVLQYSDAGFDGIGVWRPKLTDFGEERGLELLREQRLHVSNLLWAGGFTGSEGFSYKDCVTDAVDALQLASLLGADSLVIYTGSRSGHTRNHARRLCRSAINELHPLAAELGVVLAIEPVHEACTGEWSIIHTLQQALEFVDYFDSPYVKFVFDTYQLSQTQFDLKDIAMIADRVALIRIADSQHPLRGEINCCLPGQGNIPIGDIVSALSEGGFSGYCDIKVIGEDSECCSYEQILQHSRESLQPLTSV